MRFFMGGGGSCRVYLGRPSSGVSREDVSYDWGESCWEEGEPTLLEFTTSEKEVRFAQDLVPFDLRGNEFRKPRWEWVVATARQVTGVTGSDLSKVNLLCKLTKNTVQAIVVLNHPVDGLGEQPVLEVFAMEWWRSGVVHVCGGWKGVDETGVAPAFREFRQSVYYL